MVMVVVFEFGVMRCQPLRRALCVWRRLMNGNENLIVALAVIFLPALAVLLFIMPNDRNCNLCQSRLSSHRQLTYHWKIDGKEKEICKRCYNQRTQIKFPRSRF